MGGGGSEEAGGRARGGGGARGGAGERRRGGGRGGGGARPSRSRGAATPPSLLKTLPLKWGRVFQLKKRSIFFFSKKADEVGKKGKETGTVSAAATDVATVGAKRAAKKGGKEASRKGDNAPVSVGVRGAGTGDFGGRPATKETVTGSAAAREEAALPRSAAGHSWLAAAALLAAPAAGRGRGTARGWPSGTGGRNGWALGRQGGGTGRDLGSR